MAVAVAVDPDSPGQTVHAIFQKTANLRLKWPTHGKAKADQHVAMLWHKYWE
jgi:hypothetical protein